MKQERESVALKRVIISGGGTGGHIHPAVAIADEIKNRYPDCKILFVGAIGRMEMEKVPQSGYPIQGLWISGIDRNWRSKRNLAFPFKLVSSLIKAARIIRKFKPQIAVGVGGFASGPLLYRAALKGIPTAIQEQNSFPGITNRLLANKVQLICAGFPGLDRWFPADRIIETGNPLRENVTKIQTLDPDQKASAFAHFGFHGNRPVAFVMGGSLGAGSMNDAVLAIARKIEKQQKALPYDLLWQCGARFQETMEKVLGAMDLPSEQRIVCVGFIDRMDHAYSVADVIASRAGAMSIAELALVGKPTLLIPSPVVAEDHQTKNARSLSDRGGALLISDSEIVDRLEQELSQLFDDPKQQKSLTDALKGSARPNAAKDVVTELEKLLMHSI
jgi:UDP-N-acetylglucosamine--N-acetylmuramyl-(pentapeptide) pyrophosphoryl-undecaprenol N-acetylglucosamine transferase